MKAPLKEHIEKIVPLTAGEYEFVLSHFTPAKFKKHQFLIQEGQNAECDFFVVSGLVKAYYTDASGKEHILQFAMEDWWISDFDAYFNQKKATLNVDCIEDTEVYCITLENREKLCAEMHKIEHFFRKKSNSGYIALQQRILSLLTESASERYAQLLRQYPSLIQRVPKTLLASYLRVSRETLSRLT